MLAGVRWPHRISNKALYDKLEVEPLEALVQRARVKLFGHVLRMELEAPAQRAMDFYMRKGKRRRGRPRCCLPVALHGDMQRVGLQFTTAQDLHRQPETSLLTGRGGRTSWTRLRHVRNGVYLRDESRGETPARLLRERKAVATRNCE